LRVVQVLRNLEQAGFIPGKGDWSVLPSANPRAKGKGKRRRK
jgi:hypothetical protein